MSDEKKPDAPTAPATGFMSPELLFAGKTRKQAVSTAASLLVQVARGLPVQPLIALYGLLNALLRLNALIDTAHPNAEGAKTPDERFEALLEDARASWPKILEDVRAAVREQQAKDAKAYADKAVN